MVELQISTNMDSAACASPWECTTTLAAFPVAASAQSLPGTNMRNPGPRRARYGIPRFLSSFFLLSWEPSCRNSNWAFWYIGFSFLSPNMGLISRLFLLSPAFTGTAVLAISAPAPAPEVFAGSNPSCPAFPAPEPGTYCGPYTRYYTEYCQNQAALTDFTGYVNRPKDYLVDAGDYAFYHMLHTEYLVEFSKYPVKPYQKPLSLPYCGLPHYDGIHKRGNWWKEKVDKPWKGFVSNVAKGTPTLRRSRLLCPGYLSNT